MIIHDGFYLNGFTRIDKGEEGAVFLRYGAPKRKSKKEPEFISCRGTEATYAVSLPLRPIEACAIVTRSSKNCYQATAYDERRIASFKADSLDGLRRAVATFFEEVAV